MKGNENPNRFLIVGMAPDGNDAVSAIMINLLRSASDRGIFDCVGCKSRNRQKINVPNINDFSVQDVFSGKRHLYLHIKNILKIFHIKAPLLSSRYLYRKLLRLRHSYKRVIALSAGFAYTEAAYRYAKKYHIPLTVIWFDPFLLNPLIGNTHYTQKKQEQWLNYADKFLYNRDNSYTEALTHRAEPFDIPLYTDSTFTNNTDSTLIYGGRFYKEFRSPKAIFTLSEQICGTSMHIMCYANLTRNVQKYSDTLTLLPCIPSFLFREECQKAKAIICIGNENMAFQPSKYLEAIGMRKPIVGIHIPMQSELRKYPFFVDADEQDWIEKLNGIQPEEQESFDPYRLYPDRKPSLFLKQIFD